jgi:hypothetical protein
MMKSIHKLQESFSRMQDGGGRKHRGFSWMVGDHHQIIQGMNNNSFDDLAMITNIMHV